MSTTDTPKTDAAERWAEELVQRMFAGRKGHGGSDGVVYIQLRPDVLWEIAHESFEYGRHSQNRELAEALSRIQHISEKEDGAPVIMKGRRLMIHDIATRALTKAAL